MVYHVWPESESYCSDNRGRSLVDGVVMIYVFSRY